jgi:hypothetical protein
LNEEDVPPGEWLCPRCKALHDIKNKPIEQRTKISHVKNSATRRNHITNSTDKNKINVHRPIGANTQHRNTSNDHSTNKQQSTDDISAEDSHKMKILNDLIARKNPFAELVRISLLLNPREFELPEEWLPDVHFPGSFKKPVINTSTREGRYTWFSVKRAQDLDRNNLPLILRTCYVCRKGCRKAPLINCDYCPLVYHFDCVDPPLTILPNTRWMCPNHVEPIAEEKLLTSSSYCERVKLWNHFAKPIDHERIKISFLDRVHNSPEPAMEEAGTIAKLGCRVPKVVKEQYDKYIRTIDKYHGEEDEAGEEEKTKLGGSEAEESECTIISTNQARQSPNHAIDQQVIASTSQTNTNLNSNDEYKKLQNEHESLIDIALRYMIESSKLLESKEHQQPINGDKT